MLIFLLALASIVVVAMFPELRTITAGEKPIGMAVIIQMMMLPVDMSLGLPPALLLAIMPSSYGHFFILNYPSDIATVNFDSSGTTKIGKWYFNHSFMVPGLIAVPTACIVDYFIAMVVIG